MLTRCSWALVAFQNHPVDCGLCSESGLYNGLTFHSHLAGPLSRSMSWVTLDANIPTGLQSRTSLLCSVSSTTLPTFIVRVFIAPNGSCWLATWTPSTLRPACKPVRPPRSYKYCLGILPAFRSRSSLHAAPCPASIVIRGNIDLSSPSQRAFTGPKRIPAPSSMRSGARYAGGSRPAVIRMRRVHPAFRFYYTLRQRGFLFLE
ncbi:hypothetical protein R3P38DRAFT_601048 [Favolaschia claudopus]|uniref:Uncharacterized protein n=1 Tax=Favolaschia claudopus TaxID=2862362 RepID=A0AAV9Z6X6_9AGAR